MIISAILFIVFLALGFPIYISLLTTGIYILVFEMNMDMSSIVLVLFDSVFKFTLAAVPFFLLAGALMETSSMAKRMVNWLFYLVSRYRGGAPLTGVLASEFFATISGSSAASTATVGKILYPEISKASGESFALGLLTSCGALAVVMPPSITMILYGATASISTGALFLTGIVPALLIGGLISFYIIWRSNKVETAERFSFKEFMLRTKNAFWILILPAVILGGIYGGLFTPTEAASVAAVYATVVAIFIYREMGLRTFFGAIKDAMMLNTQIFIIIASSTVFSQALTFAQVPQKLTALTSDLSPVVFILIINLFLLLVGMFFDPTSAVLVITPLLVPICNALGIDLIQMGLIMTVNLAIGMFTPPFGLNLFVSQGVFKKSMAEVVASLKPFWVWYLLSLAIISYIPQLYMWLPDLMK
ncbi:MULTISPECIES: TRAP transporter large permease [Paenibacillus]|uniref:Membrane protein n=2 Tax=Paenibacillus naphthalenovorans TaxID=162209 RepID=A0A0U2MWP6_9BACL|nr:MULTISPECIES: TRAP transporter large permease subunit [Paenibacillus]ALS22367.1 membrane protein [Paenibacillus naphthalenovorans]SDH90345.1 C4-dicarboxylate transporter, DctM subunit [Paenibacillus naphthalenovorans]